MNAPPFRNYGAGKRSRHAEFVKLIENKGSVVKTPGGGAVVLDLRPLVAHAAEQVGVPSSTVAKLPAKVAEIQVVKSKNLQTMQTAVNVLRNLALALPLLALLLYGLAIYLARGRRPRALIEVGVALVFAGVIVLIARSLIGKIVVESLASTAAIQPAAAAAWSIGTGILVSVAGAVIFIGVPVILTGLIGGPTWPASGLRRSIAPYLRDRPGFAFGAMGALLIILIAWGPIAATRNWLGILIIIALAMFAIEMLRRETALEFPDAQIGPPVWLQARMESFRHRFSGAQAGLRADAHAARQRWRPNGPPPQSPVPPDEPAAPRCTAAGLRGRRGRRRCRVHGGRPRPSRATSAARGTAYGRRAHRRGVHRRQEAADLRSRRVRAHLVRPGRTPSAEIGPRISGHARQALTSPTPTRPTR